MTGYNVFVGRYIEAVSNEESPEVPEVLTWTMQDGQPIPGVWLVVRWEGKALFRQLQGCLD